MESPQLTRVAWCTLVLLAVASRLWNALEVPLLRGYDALGHVSYALFLDLYRSIPYADQGWSFFHPPLHYLLGFLLAQAGDAVVLVRGLGLVSSAASLGIAGLAGWMARLAVPARPLLAPLVFLAVAFVPVHVYTSPMPGNEQTAAFLSSLGFALFVRNQLRDKPTYGSDVTAGAVLGLALLAKFTGLLPVAAALSTLALGAWRDPAGRKAWARAAKRALLLTGAALLLCAPHYIRNMATFGTPFELSRGTPLVSKVELSQPPGRRGWLDLVRPAPRALLDPDVRAKHLMNSIWGSAYVHVWTDARAVIVTAAPRWTRDVVVWLGLVPSALGVVGFALSVRRGARERKAGLDTALVVLTFVNLGAFVVMAYRVPTWAILKASYLLQLSLPFGLFLARSLDALERRGWRTTVRLTVLGTVVTCGVAAFAHTPGVAYERGGENAQMAAIHHYFGNHERAERVFAEQLRETPWAARRVWISEALAGVHLSAGRSERARELYAGALQLKPGPFPFLEKRTSPWVVNRLVVATALAGDRAEARALLDAIFERKADILPELLVNRAALRASLDPGGAERDLEEALERDSTLSPAWRNLAAVRERRGDAEGAAQARRRAERCARAAPRGFPYGVGDGFHLGPWRSMLVLEGDGLALYRPARAHPRQGREAPSQSIDEF